MESWTGARDFPLASAKPVIDARDRSNELVFYPGILVEKSRLFMLIPALKCDYERPCRHCVRAKKDCITSTVTATASRYEKSTISEEINLRS
jgi:hypothetical protein